MLKSMFFYTVSYNFHNLNIFSSVNFKIIEVLRLGFRLLEMTLQRSFLKPCIYFENQYYNYYYIFIYKHPN